MEIIMSSKIYATVGSTGDVVLGIQRILTAAGYNLGKGGPDKNGVDGIYGNGTKAAVTQFQIDYRLDVDGIVGEQTYEALQKLSTGDLTKPEPKPNSGFKLSELSLKRLTGVHPDLVKVVKRAIELTTQDFMVMEGTRTIEQQREYVRKGTSKTMRSRHIPSSNACGLGCAVDIVPIVNGQVSWDWAYYYPLETAMLAAAKEVGVPIEWGGRWTSIKDGPHFQLPASKYPYK